MFLNCFATFKRKNELNVKILLHIIIINNIFSYFNDFKFKY